MVGILCLVQEGQIAADIANGLRKDLHQLAKASLGGQAEISWMEVASGNGFTEAKPSTSSIVSIHAARALSQDERISAMKNICDFWMEKTGCSINEIVAAVNDPAN